MSAPFNRDKLKPMHKNISPLHLPESDNRISVLLDYKIDRCVEWINYHNFSKVALQFPDSASQDEQNDVVAEVKKYTKKEIVILESQFYGRCCVDEVAAERVSANAIILFGHSCLSPTRHFPVLYIFGQIPIDISDVVCGFRNIFSDVTSPVIIYYGIFYCGAIGEIAENLKDYENLVVSGLDIPHGEYNVTLNDKQVKITKCQRYFVLPKGKDLENYSVFYIGCQNETLINVRLSLCKCKFYSYNPIKKTTVIETLNINMNQYLIQRSYYIEKARNAKVIGLLVDTHGASVFTSAIRHLRKLIQEAGKKSFTLFVGRMNVVRLTYFAEVEILVNAAATKSTVVDCGGLFLPIITPLELEIALKQVEWFDEDITNVTELLTVQDVPLMLERLNMKHSV